MKFLVFLIQVIVLGFLLSCNNPQKKNYPKEIPKKITNTFLKSGRLNSLLYSAGIRSNFTFGLEVEINQDDYQDGSDLFITVGFPPAMKIHGKVTPVSKTKLTADNAKALWI